MHNNTSVAVLLGKGFYGSCLMTVSTVSDLIATDCPHSRLSRSTWGLARHGNVVVDTNYNWNCMRLQAHRPGVSSALDTAFSTCTATRSVFHYFHAAFSSRFN